jgi:hypothetical protein
MAVDQKTLDWLVNCPSGNPWANEGEGDNESNSQRAPYVRHRYAYLSAELDSEVAEGAPEASQPRAISEDFLPPASQKEFDDECRRIFLQYVPELERRQLPIRLRDFIAKNRAKPGRVRRRMLVSLSKYDLASTVGASSQFNREGFFTEEKLRQIESEADGQG